MTDPLYLPMKGQIEGESSYVLGLQSWNTYNYLGTERTSPDSTLNTFTQLVNYGVTDELSIRASESYVFGRTDSYSDITGTDSSVETNGFSDPTFGIAYRFIDQRHGAPVSATADLTYTPDLIAAQNAGGGQSGNNGAGRQAATFTADLGREMKRFTIDAFTGTTYNGKRIYANLGNGTDSQTDPFWNYFVGLRSQTRLTERASINAGFRWTGVGNANTTNDTTFLTTTTENPNNADFSLAFNYHFIPNRLVGQVSYDYVDYTNSSNNYVNTHSDTQTEFHNGNTVGLHLFYVFN